MSEFVQLLSMLAIPTALLLACRYVNRRGEAYRPEQ